MGEGLDLKAFFNELFTILFLTDLSSKLKPNSSHLFLWNEIAGVFPYFFNFFWFNF